MNSRQNGDRVTPFPVHLVERVEEICRRDQMFLDQDMSVFTDIAEIVEEIMTEENKSDDEPRCAAASALFRSVPN
ncbi:hypothetical protein [Caballeronia sp. KNU42]